MIAPNVINAVSNTAEDSRQSSTTASLCSLQDFTPAKPEERQSQSNKFLYFILAISVLIGTVFRLTNIEQREFYIDEALTSLNVAGYTYKNVTLLQPVQPVASQQQKNAVSVGARLIQVNDLQPYQSVNRSPGKCLTALAKNGGEHPPLYFLLSWCWQKLMGNSVLALRVLPSILSLLLLPAVYFLSIELFKNGTVKITLDPLAIRTACIATSIVALSPFQLLYAQYARQYSLWITLTAVSSYLLLCAVKSDKTASWASYGTLCALSFYTHPLSVAIALGHLLYTFGVNKFRITKQVLQNTLAISLAFLAYLPWAIQMFVYKDVSDEMLKWLARPVPIQSLIQTWLNNLSHLYFQIPSLECVLVPISGLITACGAIFLWYKGRQQLAFAVILILSGLLPMAIPDFIFGGVRSQTSRYLMPTVLGLLIPAAFFFSSLIGSKLRQLRFSGLSLLMVFLVLELVSCINISNAAEHTDLPMHGVRPREIAQALNNADRPLVICPIGRKYLSYMLTLSHYVDSSVHLLVCSSDEIPTIPTGYGSLYIFNPSFECFTRFQKSPLFKIEELPNQKMLWRMYYSRPTRDYEAGGTHG